MSAEFYDGNVMSTAAVIPVAVDWQEGGALEAFLAAANEGCVAAHLIDAGISEKEQKPLVTITDDASSTMNFTSSEELWYMGQDYILFDMFGDNLPSFGLQQVEIVGQRINGWSVSYLEFATIGNGGGGPNAVQIACDIGHQDIDWSFIASKEGAMVTTGYHPDGSAKSGITIATGFDIGQRNASDLMALKLPSDLTQKLLPYASLKGNAAEAVDGQLHISVAEAAIIDTASHSQVLANLTVAYDGAVGIGAFYSLPPKVQTAMADLAFQYNNLAAVAPKFWGAAISKDWTAAALELMNYGDSYKTRRGAEADLILEALNTGEIHDGRLC